MYGDNLKTASNPLGELPETVTTREVGRHPVFGPLRTYAEPTPRHHLWLERCPTINELLMARHELARENRLPRHGEKLVCSIPWNQETDLALHGMLDAMRGKGMWFPSGEQLAFPEVARVMDWSIVGRRER